MPYGRDYPTCLNHLTYAVATATSDLSDPTIHIAERGTRCSIGSRLHDAVVVVHSSSEKPPSPYIQREMRSE